MYAGHAWRRGIERCLRTYAEDVERGVEKQVQEAGVNFLFSKYS
jgi:hypothetical protein